MFFFNSKKYYVNCNLEYNSTLIELFTNNNLDDFVKYQIFRDVFINPEGKLKNNTNKYTIKIKDTLIKLLENNNFDKYGNYEIFKNVFINPKGKLKDSNNPDTIKINN
jgi:hypothetical protein